MSTIIDDQAAANELEDISDDLSDIATSILSGEKGEVVDMINAAIANLQEILEFYSPETT